jgi:predicted transcriptional regulator
MKPEDLLYPQSRFEVLRTLHQSPSAVSMREISYRSNVVLKNVQRAIKFLLEEKVVTRKKVGQKVYFHIINSEVSNFVSSILETLQPFEIKAKANDLKDNSVNLIDTIEERTSMIEHAKRTFKQ